MVFLDILRQQRLLCKHPNSCFRFEVDRRGEQVLRCSRCEFTFFVGRYLCNLDNFKDSVDLAEEYASWTGDALVPCVFRSDPNVLGHRMLKFDASTTLSTVQKTRDLFRALQAPFSNVEDPDAVPPPPAFRDDSRGLTKESSAIRELFGQLSTHLRTLVDRVASENRDVAGPSVGVAVLTAIHLVKEILLEREEDLFDFYFGVLVPHVQNCVDAVPEMEIWARRRYWKFYRSAYRHIKRTVPLVDDLRAYLFADRGTYLLYSGYCLEFDAVHVAVLTFLFRNNLGAVYNVVLNFAVRWLCGYYDTFSAAWCHSSDVGRSIEGFLAREATTRSGRWVSSHLKLYGKETKDLVQWFSDEFFERHRKIQSEASQSSRISCRKRYGESNDALFRFEFEKAFLQTLFTGKDPSDLYAFRAALAYHGSAVERGDFPPARSTAKGVVAECKSVYSLTKRCFSKAAAVRELTTAAWFRGRFPSIWYDDDDDDEDEDLRHDDRHDYHQNYWSKDMLQTYLESDEEFEIRLGKAFDLLCGYLESKEGDKTLSRSLREPERKGKGSNSQKALVVSTEKKVDA